MLIKVLIGFFLFLIIYQFFTNSFGLKMSLLEGLTTNSGGEYNEYDTSNPNNALILAQKNAGNIQYLKSRIDEVDALKKKVDEMSTNITQLNGQVAGLVTQQAHAVTNVTGGKTPQISGTTEPVYSAKKA